MGAVASVEVPQYHGDTTTHIWIYSAGSFSHCPAAGASGYSRDEYRLPGDVDGDGYSDIAFAGDLGPGFGLWLGSSPPCVFTGTTVSSNGYAVLALGDLDADGDLDASAASWWFSKLIDVFQNSGGSLSYLSGLPGGSNFLYGDVEIGDLTGDGLPEVVAVGVSDVSCPGDAIFRNDFTLDDIDADGDLDLVVGTMDNGDVCDPIGPIYALSWTNEGSLSFTGPDTLGSWPEEWGFWVLRNQGGNFSVEKVDTLFTPEVHTGDFDCDGIKDIVVRQRTYDGDTLTPDTTFITVFLGPSLFQKVVVDTFVQPFSFTGLEVQDFDGDGIDDLLVLAYDQDNQQRLLYFYQGDCALKISEETKFPERMITPLLGGVEVRGVGVLQVYDVMGRLRFSKEIRGHQRVSLPLEPGVYIATFQGQRVKVVK